MSDDNEMHRFLGEHEARLTEMERWRGRMEDRMNARFDAQDAQLAHINKLLDNLAGGWKLILIIAAAIALLSDGAFRIYHMILGH